MRKGHLYVAFRNSNSRCFSVRSVGKGRTIIADARRSSNQIIAYGRCLEGVRWSFSIICSNVWGLHGNHWAFTRFFLIFVSLRSL